MKKLLLFLLLSTCFTLCAQDNSSWDEWQRTSCYSKISYRMKDEQKIGDQYHWKIQFRSDYNEVVSFNYHVTDKLEEYAVTTHRKTMNPGKMSEEIDVYTTGSNIYLLVDKLSLSPYPENFADCDN
ncbi:hypothetical protein ACX0HA_10515 [Flavobacterium hauense]